MTVAQFRRWLESKRRELAYVSAYYEDYTIKNYRAATIAIEASQITADLCLHELMRDWGEQAEVLEVDRYLVECLGGIPESDILSLAEAATYLGYSESGLRKIVKRKEIRFAQNGQGPIKFQREWLDDFLTCHKVDRSQAQSRRAPISIQTEHGFDPKLLS